MGVNVGQIVASVVERGEEAVKVLGKPAERVAKSMRRRVRYVQSKGLTGVRSPEAALFYTGVGDSRKSGGYSRTSLVTEDVTLSAWAGFVGGCGTPSVGTL